MLNQNMAVLVSESVNDGEKFCALHCTYQNSEAVFSFGVCKVREVVLAQIEMKEINKFESFGIA